MKKIIFAICTLLCANVLFAQSTFTIGDLTYGVISTNPPQVEVHDANLSITTANIPETVTYNETTYSVTSIEEWAFCNCSSLTSVTLPNSIASIGNDAFYKCSSLTSISIGNSLTYIGYDAFYNCSSLNTLNFNAINCNDFYNLSPFFSQKKEYTDNRTHHSRLMLRSPYYDHRPDPGQCKNKALAIFHTYAAECRFPADVSHRRQHHRRALHR